MNQEADISDASLVEEDDEENPEIGAGHAENQPEAFIDLPGVPVTAPAASDMETDIDSPLEQPEPDSPAPDDGDTLSEEDFRGFAEEDLEVALKREAVPFDEEVLDEWQGLPPHSWVILPREKGLVLMGAQAKSKRPFPVSPTTPLHPPKLAKKAVVASPSTPLSRRESREWRPSAMLFKPLLAGMKFTRNNTLLIHEAHGP